jgi:hypothetical protein
VLSDVSTVINAFTAGTLHALSVLSNATGRTEQAASLAAQAEAVKVGMNAAFWNSSSGLYSDGTGSAAASTHSAWHAQTNTLWAGAEVGLVAPSKHPSMLAFLKQKRMSGSVYGAYAFLLALYEMDFDHGQV